MAAQFVNSIVKKIGDYLLAQIGSQLGSLLCYNRNIEDFSKAVKKLETERAVVQRLVDAAQRNGEDILPNVQAWLTSVNEITEESTNFFDELQENKRCFYGLCPDLMSRYQRSMIAKKKTAVADDLKQEGRFDKVSCPAPPPAFGSTSTTDAEVFESRKSVFEKIMEALKDDQINMIGIYGMGGVGKTTLVEKVGKQAKDDNLFDEVVKIVVSQTPNLIKIQEEIAERIGLYFDVKSESVRSEKLFAILAQKKSVLVILDDIWARVELGAIGIPSGANHKGCKIVLTSRKKDVCNQMGTQKDFSIKILLEKEAWTLFSKMVGDSVDSPRLRPTAVEVAKECGGLPLAIVAVARALRNKDLCVWHDALNRLQKSIQEKDVSTALKFSYNQLESEEAKFFFLLCSLFPEDFDIAIQDLLKFGLGLGLFQDVDTVEEATMRAHTLAYNLKSSCLLLDSYSKERIRMHDVVRDVAISIASKDSHVFLVKAGLGLKEWPKKDTYKPYTAISVMLNDIDELPDGLECPELQILLASYSPSLQFPENFFLRMENLKVLDMSSIHFLSLPPSLRYLINLRTLCLDNCRLKDISRIGELKKLEVLSIFYSDITELPKEMAMLTHLRLLDLSGCGQLAIIPPDVIRGLSRLEGLYMKYSFDKWETEGQQNQRSNASLADLKRLSRLIILETHIRDASLLPEDSLFQNLLRFRISIGTRFERDEEYPKCLSLKVHASTPLKNGVSVLLKKAEHLELREMKGLKSMIYGLDREGFPNLRLLDVEACHEVEYVFNATEGVSPVAFPILEILVLSNLANLKEICYGQLPTGLFSELQELRLRRLPGLINMWKDPAQHVCFRNLRVVTVDGCNGLKNLFSHSIAKDLSKLVELEVRNCEIMEEIFGNEKEAASAMDDIVFPHLHSLELTNLPNLRNFCSKMKCWALKGDVDSHTKDPLLDKKDAFPALETLLIDGVGNFEEMWFPQFPAMSFSLLKSLTLYGCEKVLNIVLLNLLPRLRNLEELHVGECDSVEELIEVEGLTVEKGRVIQTPSQLTTLSLLKLPKLKHLWWDKWIPHGTLGFLNLTQLFIRECHGVKSLFSPYIATCLVQLDFLKLESCQMIETIIAEEREGEEKRIETIVFPQLRLLDLVNLPKLISFYTGRCALLNWPSLRTLTIRECPAMKSFTCRFSSVQKQRTNDEIMTEASQEYNLDDPIQPLFPKEVIFPTLDDLRISGLENLKDIWHPQLPVESFPGLRILGVKSCHKLLNVFPSNWLQGLKNLRRVNIVKCHSLENILEIDGEGHASVSRFQLEEVELRDLPNLKVFYSGNDNLALPSLERLQLVDCPKMQTFSSRFISTPKLKIVEIEHYEMVWKDDLNSTVQYIFQEKGKLDSVVSSGQEVQEEEEEGEKLNKMSKEAEKAEEEVEREENVSAQAIQQEISEFVEEEA